MDADTRRRIEEEERYRAQVRKDIATREAPGYWTGFVLNLLIIGVGHFVIGEVVWGVVWLLLAIFLVPATGFLAWPFIAFGVLIHYRNSYAHKYRA